MSFTVKSERKIGVILGYITQAINILSGLLYTPVMLRLLGQSEYGLYQLVASTVANLSLLNLGFTSSYMRFYAEAESKSDKHVNKLNGMFMTIFGVMSLICIVCGIVLISFVDVIFGDKLSVDEYSKARILFAITIFSMAISFPTSVFTCNINAHERFAFQRVLGLVQSILNPFICLPLIILGHGSIAVVSVAALLSLARLICEAYYCLKKLKMRFVFNKFDKELFKRMNRFTLFIFLNQIVDLINWNLDKFILGKYSGLDEVARYSIGSQINSLYMTFSNLINGVFSPQINRLVEKGSDDKELSNIFIKVGRIQFILIALICSGFIIFGEKFILLWAGTGYKRSYYVALVMMIPMIVPLIQNIGIEIQRAKNKHQVRTIVYVVLAVFNLFLTIFLVPKYGAIGAAIGTAIAITLGNIIFMNWYYYVALGIDIPKFWKQILRIAIVSILVFFIGRIIWNQFNVKNWVELFLGIAIYTLAYFVIIFFAGMNGYEKSMVKSILTKKYK